jgi:hypothetical protein
LPPLPPDFTVAPAVEPLPPPPVLAATPAVAAAPAPKSKKSKKKSKKKILLIVIPVVVVLLLAAFAFLLFFTDILPFGPNRSGETDPPDPSPSAEEPSPSPSPSPSGEDQPGTVVVQVQTGTIPGEGGEFRVEATTEFTFTPNRFGIWEFVTSDNGRSDPFLEIHDAFGNFIAWDDDGADGFNARIIIYLTAGETYTVLAGFYGGVADSYLLSVFPSN